MGGESISHAEAGRFDSPNRPGIAAAKLALAGAWMIFGLACWPAANSRPNVLLITLDTTRADHLGSYGYHRDTSPNLDRLASEGCRFERAIAQASVTPVSHASILTGQNPYTHGLRVLHGVTGNRLAEAHVTLAERLRDAGYRTGAFISSFPVSKRFGLHQGFDEFDDEFLQGPLSNMITADGRVNTGRNQRGAEETTRRALAWLDEAAGPFFLWVHYFDPHDAKLQPPKQYVETAPWRPASTRTREVLATLYDVEIRYMDASIGSLLDGLRAAGRLDDTVVVAVSDHGEGLGDHGWWTHGLLYQEQIRVPLIIKAPGRPHGVVAADLVRTVDIAPTVLDLVDLEVGEMSEMEGRSLTPMLNGDSVKPQPPAYADSLNMLTYNTQGVIQDIKADQLLTLVDGRYKYIHHVLRPEESELYDLIDDPYEARNILSEHLGIVQGMQRELKGRVGRSAPASDAEKMSAADRARLEALGYIDEASPEGADAGPDD